MKKRFCEVLPGELFEVEPIPGHLHLKLRHEEVINLDVMCQAHYSPETEVHVRRDLKLSVRPR